MQSEQRKSKPKNEVGESSEAQTDLPEVTVLLTRLPPKEGTKCCVAIVETLEQTWKAASENLTQQR